MKSKIIKTILVIFLLIGIGLTYNVSRYATEQEFAQIAAQQFEDYSAYYELKTKKSAYTIYNVIYAIATIGSLSLFYVIWKPKKVKEVEQEEI